MRRFRRRRMRTFWTGSAVQFVVSGGQAADYTAFTSMLRADELLDRAPHGVTHLRTILDCNVYVTANGGPNGSEFGWDLFMMGRQSAQDDAGNEILVSGTNVFKPFVQADLASTGINADRSFMWTKRQRFFWLNAASSAQNYYGCSIGSLYNTGAVWNYGGVWSEMPMVGGHPWLDLKVKRRLELGENVVFGAHFPTGTPVAISAINFMLNYRMLLKIN